MIQNYMKKNEIVIEGGNRGFIQKDGTIKNRKGGHIFCGKCCKKHNIHPSSNRPQDIKKAIELGIIFKINEDKTKVICQECGREIDVLETYESRQEKINEKNKKDLENLHIVKVAESWETGLSYYGLSTRIEYEDWLKVKQYFHYHTASMDEDDEFFGPAPRGWVCMNYHAVEEALNIPLERTFDVLHEKEQKEREEARKKEAEKKALIQECKDAFKDAEKPEGEHIKVEGEKIQDPNYPMNIYGGGHWWVIQEEYIWFVRNNGSDGANWGLNNVATGGAGAIGVRLPYSDELAEKIRSLRFL